ELKKEKAGQGVPEADRRAQETLQRPFGTTRRIEGVAQPSGGTGRRIEFPPAKRPPTGREF
ncbi:MAG: hypothetical protein ABIK07_01360, partial [Planctomycetota bacterium]